MSSRVAHRHRPASRTTHRRASDNDLPARHASHPIHPPQATLPTALYDLHLSLKGKMVPFAGYTLPVLYETEEGGVMKEVGVRGQAGSCYRSGRR